MGEGHSEEVVVGGNARRATVLNSRARGELAILLWSRKRISSGYFTSVQLIMTHSRASALVLAVDGGDSDSTLSGAVGLVDGHGVDDGRSALTAIRKEEYVLVD